MKRIRIPAFLSLATLALVGCATTEADNGEPQDAGEAQQEYADELDTEDMQPEQETAGHGTYRLHATEGADIEFDLPTDPGHELLVELEDFREQIGQDPVTYIVADIDNRQGTVDINIPSIRVYDPDGQEYEFEALGNTLLEWEPEYDDSDYYWDTYDRILDFQDELDNSASVAERNTTVLLYHGADLSEEFTRVAVQPYGIGAPEEAYLAE